MDWNKERRASGKAQSTPSRGKWPRTFRSSEAIWKSAYKWTPPRPPLPGHPHALCRCTHVSLRAAACTSACCGPASSLWGPRRPQLPRGPQGLSGIRLSGQRLKGYRVPPPCFSDKAFDSHA